MAEDRSHYGYALRAIQRSRLRLVVKRPSLSPASSDKMPDPPPPAPGSRKRRLSFQGLMRNAFGLMDAAAGAGAQSPGCKRPRSELFGPPKTGEFVRMLRLASGGAGASASASPAFADPECVFLFAVRDLHRKERVAHKPLLPRYSDVLNVLVPGDRRRAANIILAVAAKMDLEPCTASAAVLLMDRFLSHFGKGVPSSSLAYTALMCLNVAGKIHDLDNNFFGTSRFMTLVRDCVRDAETKQATVKQFMLVAGSTEERIFRVLDAEFTATPPALEYVHMATGWGPRSADPDQLNLWEAAVFLCDLFCTYTEATDYAQVEIARAALHVLGHEPAGPDPQASFVYVAERMRAAARQFFGTADARGEPTNDPYIGVRMRHHLRFGAMLLMRTILAATPTETPEGPVSQLPRPK